MRKELNNITNLVDSGEHYLLEQEIINIFQESHDFYKSNEVVFTNLIRRAHLLSIFVETLPSLESNSKDVFVGLIDELKNEITLDITSLENTNYEQ